MPSRRTTSARPDHPARPAAVPPVVAVVGSEPWLSAEAVREWVRFSGESADRVDFDGDSVDLATVLDELRTISLFGRSERKCVVIRDADAFLTRYREPLEDYLSATPATGPLVLRCGSLPRNQRIYKVIERVGRIVDAQPIKGAALSRWVSERAGRVHGLRASPDAVTAIIDLLGGDLGRIDQELAKLAIGRDAEGVPTDRPVDAAAVRASVTFQREQEMWQWTDTLPACVTAGDPSAAVRRWRDLIRLVPSSEFRAVTWLAIWLERASDARTLRQDGQGPAEIARTLRIWPADAVKPLLEAAERLGSHRLAALTRELARVDRRNKSGVGTPAGNVERFLVDLVTASRSGIPSRHAGT